MVTHPRPRMLPAVEAPEFELVIRPRPGWISVDWKELWQFRELMYFQVWRDVKVRYKQTALGVAWAILVPVFSMVIFTMIFGNFADMKGKLPLGENYSLFVYAGLAAVDIVCNGAGDGRTGAGESAGDDFENLFSSPVRAGSGGRRGVCGYGVVVRRDGDAHAVVSSRCRRAIFSGCFPSCCSYAWCRSAFHFCCRR